MVTLKCLGGNLKIVEKPVNEFENPSKGMLGFFMCVRKVDITLFKSREISLCYEGFHF